MKKYKVLISVILAAMMFMGIGYATWGQYLPVTIIGSNSSLNVYFTNDSNFEPNPYVKTNLTVIRPSLVTSSCINASIDGLYPNAQVKINAVIRNDSTMPVLLNNINITPLTGSTKYLTVCIGCANNLWISAAKTTNTSTSVRIEPKASTTVSFVIALDPSAGNETQSDHFAFAITPEFTTVK